jgi:hypothetical protein
MLLAATLASLGILNLTLCIDCGQHAERNVLRMRSWLYLHHLYIPLVWCLDTEPLLHEFIIIILPEKSNKMQQCIKIYYSIFI